MEITYKTNVNNNQFKHMLVYLFVLFLSSCNYQYLPKNINNISVEIATENVEFQEINQKLINSLIFKNHINGEMVNFSQSPGSVVFRITQNRPSDSQYSLLVMPHYLNKVISFDNHFNVIGEYHRNKFKLYRDYSPNIVGFDNVSSVSYIVIEDETSKRIHFSIEDQKHLKAYDQKLLMTFTAVDSIILTLVFIHFIFYFFIKKTGYLLYSLYIFSVLFSMLFQEGMIAYFPVLSYPVFGDYTKIIWLKLPSILYWLFTIVFLDLKSRSKFDYRLAVTMLIIESMIVLLLLILSVLEISGIYVYLANAINLYFIISIIVAIYIPVKYAFLNVKHAQYLAIGVLIHMITVIMRLKYATTLEPLSFWMPRAFEFGLLFEALILSFGLADKTMRVIKQRDVAELKIKRVDRELFCKELEKSFQQKAINTIDKYYGTQLQLNRIIHSNFISSLQQLVEVEDVFYVSEDHDKIITRLISSKVMNFNIDNYIKQNTDLMNNICATNKASYQENPEKENSELPFVIIPIKENDHDNLCLFLSIPSYAEIDNNLIQDLYVFANTMTLSLLTMKKYQKTVKDSRFDNLTKVFSRKTIETKLEVLMQRSPIANDSVAVAFIDIDNFKEINDIHGHEIGDEVLIFLCDKLKKEFATNAFVGRYGGDEFIVVFNHYSQSQIEFKLNELYVYFATHAIRDIELKISIGVALNSYNKATSGKELLRVADAALYRAKENGKNQFIMD